MEKRNCPLLFLMFTRSVGPESRLFQIVSSPDMVNITTIPIISNSKIYILFFPTSSPLRQNFSYILPQTENEFGHTVLASLCCIAAINEQQQLLSQRSSSVKPGLELEHRRLESIFIIGAGARARVTGHVSTSFFQLVFFLLVLFGLFHPGIGMCKKSLTYEVTHIFIAFHKY